ncbi:hypothetical protein CAEBREN_20087 [Caenorhabditis brenneri]|uniref:Uncharacterized protein n=1 Tax=Caenorhabditis brenneri TaxID=135651 RepID=G0MXD5_CAEBE|nr:hypothetical protein CAEBREN_20087 [Caenorhabditis brenneri]
MNRLRPTSCLVRETNVRAHERYHLLQIIKSSAGFIRELIGIGRISTFCHFLSAQIFINLCILAVGCMPRTEAGLKMVRNLEKQEKMLTDYYYGS